MLFLGLALAQRLFESKILQFFDGQIDSDTEVKIMADNIDRSLSGLTQAIHGAEYQTYYYRRHSPV